jgi:hypothetical protein
MSLARPFIGRLAGDRYASFVGPVIDTYIQKDEEGVDWLFHDAPLALYFYGSSDSDPADAVIAATYAMLAGEALGLASCLLGFPGQVLGRHKSLRVKYGLPEKAQTGITISFGYPAVHYRRAIKRRFAQVQYG